MENKNEEFGLVDEELYDEDYLGNAIFFQGKIYATTLLCSKLVVANFNFNGSSLQFQPLIGDDGILQRNLKSYLMESHGEVLVVNKIH